MDLKIKKLGAKISVLHHDNKSSICLEANCKRSSTKQTKHIDIRYLYVTDKVKSRDVVIVHHLIEVLVRDFLSIPLKWTPSKFQKDTLIELDGEISVKYKERYENTKVMYRKFI